jgi:hypothetical protein
MNWPDLLNKFILSECINEKNCKTSLRELHNVFERWLSQNTHFTKVYINLFSQQMNLLYGDKYVKKKERDGRYLYGIRLRKNGTTLKIVPSTIPDTIPNIIPTISSSSNTPAPIVSIDQIKTVPVDISTPTPVPIDQSKLQIKATSPNMIRSGLPRPPRIPKFPSVNMEYLSSSQPSQPSQTIPPTIELKLITETK